MIIGRHCCLARRQVRQRRFQRILHSVRRSKQSGASCPRRVVADRCRLTRSSLSRSDERRFIIHLTNYALKGNILKSYTSYIILFRDTSRSPIEKSPEELCNFTAIPFDICANLYYTIVRDMSASVLRLHALVIS